MWIKNIFANIERILKQKGYIDAYYKWPDGNTLVHTDKNVYRILHDARSPNYVTLMIGDHDNGGCHVVKDGNPLAVEEWVQTTLQPYSK